MKYSLNLRDPRSGFKLECGFICTSDSEAIEHTEILISERRLEYVEEITLLNLDTEKEIDL